MFDTRESDADIHTAYGDEVQTLESEKGYKVKTKLLGPYNVYDTL